MRAAKVDANQADIVAALRKVGCDVYVASSFGQGFPDLVVLLPGAKGQRRVMLLEVKDGDKPPSARKLTPDQVKFHAIWAGESVRVVDSVEAAIETVMGG